jgi:hypothetical protein
MVVSLRVVLDSGDAGGGGATHTTTALRGALVFA